MTSRYWLSIGDGKTYGPYTVDELLRFRAEGRLAAGAQLCAEGSTAWVPAEGVVSFPGTTVVPPVAPPPTAPGAHMYPANAKSKIAAGVLGILIGWLGVHNFYLGYTGKGVAQLLITVLTCGYGSVISGIWGLIEGILILTGAIATDASGAPLRD